MKFVTISELRHNTAQIVGHIESNKEFVIVTKNGKPIILMRPLEVDALEFKTKREGSIHLKD